ncbi:MAG: nascent polypeptide-associated complex protein [Candidatus Micrarchaeia archaeon]
MMPNLDPRAMKNLMERMGIKTSEIDAIKVTIECEDKNIVIENPSVTKIDAKGQVSFEISGNITENPISKEESYTPSEDDIKIVAEQAKVSTEQAYKALVDSNGNIAEAILSFKPSP